MTYEESGFGPFLRRRVSVVPLAGEETIAQSPIGPQQALSPGQQADLFPGGTATVDQLIAGVVLSDRGTIGGWTIANSTLSSSNITIDSTNKRILISDGTNNRVLIGYQASGF
jgi:hypothetical protein